MKVKFIKDVLFKRLGDLKTVESEIDKNPDYFNNTLHFYKCKKYGKCINNVIELGIYFKFIINNKICHDKEFKIIVDIYPTERESYFNKDYDIGELSELLSKYDIDDIDKVCEKVVKSIKHDYF